MRRAFAHLSFDTSTPSLVLRRPTLIFRRHIADARVRGFDNASLPFDLFFIFDFRPGFFAYTASLFFH